MGAPKREIMPREEIMVEVDDNCDEESQCDNGIMMRAMRNNKG